MRHKAKVRQTLLYGSTKIALRKGWVVYIEIGPTTVWVYQLPKPDKTERHDLLYTFNSKDEARGYLVLLKEKD